MALSANKMDSQGKVAGRTISPLIYNAAVIYDGAMVCANATGFAIPATKATAGLRFLGVAIRGGTGDSSTVVCVIERRGTRVFKATAADATWLGLPAYVVDDEEVTITAPSGSGGNDYLVGRIIRVVSTTKVEVDLEDRPVTGLDAETVTRANLATENAVRTIDLRSLWKSDFSAILPSSAASGELGYINATHGSSSVYLRGETSATTKSNVGRMHLVLPANYVAGEDVILTIHAKTNSAPVTSASVDVTAYEKSKEAGIGSDLNGTAAIACTAAYGDKAFTIDGTLLVPGDVLDILITAAIADNGSNNYVIIGDIRATIPSKV